MTAYNIWEDGKQWLRVVDEQGFEHEEPMTGWSIVHNLTNGVCTWRHNDGREYRNA